MVTFSTSWKVSMSNMTTASMCLSFVGDVNVVQAVWRSSADDKKPAASRNATHSGSETDSDEVRLNTTLLYAVGIS